MRYPSEPSVDFDYESLDEPSPEIDAEFWKAQGEWLRHILHWLTEPQSLSRIGARVYVLFLYLRPEAIPYSSMHQIGELDGAPTRAAMSKALLELQRKYTLKPGVIQKPLWARERYRRSALAAHRRQDWQTTKTQ